jgi:hypothetical protein
VLIQARTCCARQGNLCRNAIRGENGRGCPSADKIEFFENNRNLFYVVCSRPKVRLAILFTQVLSANAMARLTAWFDADNLVALPADPEAAVQA